MQTLERWPFAPDLRGRALYFAKAYDRLVREADELVVQAPVQDGKAAADLAMERQPRGTKTGDPVAAAAIRRERIRHEISIIEGALNDIEPEFRAGVIDNVCRGVPMHMLDLASESTWKRKRRVFLAGIVERAGLASRESEWIHA